MALRANGHTVKTPAPMAVEGNGHASNGNGQLPKLQDRFCDPKAIGENIFHESANGTFFAVANIRPFFYGQSLITTTQHKQNPLQLTPSEGAELFGTVFQVLPLLMDLNRDPKGRYEIKLRSGNASGWTDDHFHLHLIARDASDTLIYRDAIARQKRDSLDVRHVAAELGSALAMNGYVHYGMPTSVPPEVRDISLPKTLKAKVFDSSEHFVALEHPKPVVPGHVLIVPKRSVGSLLDLTRTEVEDFMSFYTKLVLQTMREHGDSTRSYITTMQTGEYPGVPKGLERRLHIQLVPRRLNDPYSGGHDMLFHHLYENEGRKPLMSRSEVEEEMASLRRSK